MTSPAPKRIAIVTGASRGIGRAIALRLASTTAGAGGGRHVVLMARNAEALERVRHEIAGLGGEASVRVCDVSDSAQLAGAIEGVAEEHGRLDILVNNAGITRDGLILRMSDEDWAQVIQTNLTSAFVAIRAAARPMMKGRFGRIISISSTSGLVGNSGQANYAAAKSGLIGLTRSVARELGGKGITANVVAPGFVETDMTADLPEQIREGVLSMLPVKRLGTPEDIAEAVAYAAGESAGFLTGQVITVDGGMTMC